MFKGNLGRVGRGMRGMGDFVNRDYKNESWLPNTFGSNASIIPGVSNAAAGGGIVAALAAAWAAWKFLK